MHCTAHKDYIHSYMFAIASKKNYERVEHLTYKEATLSGNTHFAQKNPFMSALCTYISIHVFDIPSLRSGFPVHLADNNYNLFSFKYIFYKECLVWWLCHMDISICSKDDNMSTKRFYTKRVNEGFL